MTFILMFGIVSLFSDMTHESASSIRGAFLALLGASAATIGFVSGLGEMVGYGMRYVFGRITDRTRLYWPMVIAGYVIDIVAVPALALVGPHGWIAACALLIVQRMGKAIKKPAKDTIMSFAATQQGAGKSFAIREGENRKINWSKLLDGLAWISCGYGVRPRYTVFLSCFFILLFAFLYWQGMGIVVEPLNGSEYLQGQNEELTFLDNLYFSAMVFTAKTQGQVVPSRSLPLPGHIGVHPGLAAPCFIPCEPWPDDDPLERRIDPSRP